MNVLPIHVLMDNVVMESIPTNVNVYLVIMERIVTMVSINYRLLSFFSRYTNFTVNEKVNL